METGDLALAFVDLVLPAHGGRTLRFTRTYSNHAGTPWALGLAGFPSFIHEGNLPCDEGINLENHLALVTGGPVLVSSDGGARQLFYMTMPTAADPSTHRWVETEDHLIVFDRDLRRLYLPDGTVCRYDEPVPNPENPVGWRVSACVLPHGCDGDSGCGAKRNIVEWQRDGNQTTVTHTLGPGEAHVVVLTQPQLDPTGAGQRTMTFGDRTWTYVYSDFDLTEVHPPLGPPWEFTYESAEPPMRFISSVRTPSGGLIEYEYEPQFREHDEDPGVWHYHGPSAREPRSTGKCP